jgi:hypothetical protein
MEDFQTNFRIFFAKSGTPKMEDFQTNFRIFFAKSGTPKMIFINLLIIN